MFCFRFFTFILRKSQQTCKIVKLFRLEQSSHNEAAPLDPEVDRGEPTQGAATPKPLHDRLQKGAHVAPSAFSTNVTDSGFSSCFQRSMAEC